MKGKARCPINKWSGGLPRDTGFGGPPLCKSDSSEVGGSSYVALANGTAASYAPKVGNCELRITEKRFVKVLKCLVQNTPKSKVL
jgi:hypothetical protein